MKNIFYNSVIYDFSFYFYLFTIILAFRLSFRISYRYQVFIVKNRMFLTYLIVENIFNLPSNFFRVLGNFTF